VFPMRYELNIMKGLNGCDVYSENVRGLNLAVVKLTTVQVTKAPL
jgi:hypothetical protein